MHRHCELWLSALIVALAIPAHLTGLVAPAIYRDPAVLLPQNLGTDLVTLGVAIPLLSLTTAAVWRGSGRSRLIWLGTLAYLVYAYGMYALGVRWNRLFLLYVALFGLSLFALIIGLVNTNSEEIHDRLKGRVPARAAATYLIVVAILVAWMWLAEELRALLGHTIPPSVVEFETPTNIVHVFDLGVVLPGMGVAAVQLLRGRPWGYVLTGMLLVKAATIGVWVVAMIWFSARRGFGAPPAYTAFFVLLTVVGAVLARRFTAAPQRSTQWQLSLNPKL